MENKEQIADVANGAIKNITALVLEDNIAGFVLCDKIFVKDLYHDKIGRKEILSHKLDYDMQCCIVYAENKSEHAADVLETNSAETSLTETIAPLASVQFANVTPPEVKILTNSSAKSLKELNSKHCNIL